MSKKTLRITDDKSATTEFVVKLKCECGWTEKAFARDARTRASQHLHRNHTGGVIIYNGNALEV